MTPVELAEFRAANRVVFVPGSPGRFAELVNTEDFVALRAHAQAYQKGKRLLAASWQTAAELDAVLDDGWTLYFKNVGRRLPALKELVNALESAADARSIQAAIVCSRGSEQGYRAHQDPVDLLVLQVRGRKRWTVYADGSLAELAWTGELEDGDMLLVPKNWWHEAEPCGPTTHITLGFHELE